MMGTNSERRRCQRAHPRSFTHPFASAVLPGDFATQKAPRGALCK